VQFDVDKLPAARTLQDALKDNIGSADTGESDSKGPEKVVLQSEQCQKELKETDGHARRNRMKFRASLMEKSTPLQSKTDSASSSADTSEPSARMTKHELQTKGVETLERIAETMEETGKNTISILK
jgi:hypothetical protein